VSKERKKKKKKKIMSGSLLSFSIGISLGAQIWVMLLELKQKTRAFKSREAPKLKVEILFWGYWSYFKETIWE
jgi:hypothetical protein